MGRNAPKSNRAGRRGQGGLPRWLSMRSLVLLLVIAFAVVLVLPTLRQQLAHEQQLAQLRSQVEQAKSREDDLQAELARWDDPAYVQSQARTRLGYVKPGETAYRVLDPKAAPTTAPMPLPADGGAAPAAQGPAEVPWYLKLAETWPAGDSAGQDGKDDAGAAGKADQGQGQ